MTNTDQSLRARMLRATRWVVLGSAAMHLFRLGSNLVLTRLLVPEMFGLMAIATTVGVIMAMLSDIGLRQAVVRSARGDAPAFLDTVWVIQVIRGFLLWGGSIAAAVALYFGQSSGWIHSESTYGNEALPALIVATGFSAVIISLASTLSMSATRSFDTKLMFQLDIVSTVVGAMVMIVLAWTTHSIWSLVAGTYASTTCGAALSHWFKPGPRHRFRIDSDSLVEIFSFGKWLALSSAITVFATNGDRLILGALVNAQSLGMYSIALSLVGALSLVLGQLFDKVFLPAFCVVARADESRLADAYFRSRLRIDPIILIVSGMLFGGSHLLVGVLYDARYADVASVLQILSLSMLVERLTLVQQVYLAINRPTYLVHINLIRLISTYTLVPIGYWMGGFMGAVIAIAIRDLPVVPLIVWFNARHGLNKLKLEMGLLVFWPLGFALAFVAGAATRTLRMM